MLLPESKRAAHGRQRDEYFQRPRARPMGIGLDLSGRRKDGTEFPVEVSLSTVETDEGTFGIAFVSDISVRKTLEEQLVHAQKMEAVGRLAGGVAHDFNNMLTVIAGYNRMILDELSTLDPLRGYAEEILKAADRAGALTNQLLAFSRRQIMQPRVINLNAVIGQTEKMLRRLIGEDIQLVMSLGADTGNIKADPNHIEQAIVNLAVNARDAMPRRRTDHHRNLQCPDRRDLCQNPHGCEARGVRHDRRQRHGSRHGFRHAAAYLRTVFHHQATRKRHRTGPGHGLRHGQAERRRYLGIQRARPGHHIQTLLPAGGGARLTGAGARKWSTRARSPAKP